MESPNQRISQARSNRIPLLLFLGFCTVVVGLGAYASYQRSDQAPQKRNSERSFSPDMEYGHAMSKKLSELEDNARFTPILKHEVEQENTQDQDNFWQQYLAYLQQYDDSTAPELLSESVAPEPTPRPSEPYPADDSTISVDTTPTLEEQLQIQLRQQRATALLQALRSNTTVSGANSANSTLQKSSYANAQSAPHTAPTTTTAIGTGAGASAGAALSPQQQLALQQGQQALQYPTTPDSATASSASSPQGVSSGNNHGSTNPNAMHGLSAYQSLANSDTLLHTQMETVLSPFLLRQGVLLPCVLMTGINSDLPGLVQAQVTEDVFDSPLGQHVLIPRGTKVIGQYASAPLMGQKRLMLAFNRLIFPDGKALNLGAMVGTSPDGYAGFDAQVDTHFWQLMGNAILLGGVSAGIAISVDDGARDSDGNLTLNGALTQGLGQSLGRVLTNVIERNMTTSPTLSVQPGFVFNVTLTKDIYFPSAYHAYHY